MELERKIGGEFSSLGLEENVLKAIDSMGFTKPSDIQREAVPVLMEGYDLIGQAQTGTGKTLAFGAPMLSKISEEKGDIKSIILAPTRELAVQVSEELKRLAKFKRVKITAVYGGSSIDVQIKAIKSKTDIVVGTPGRILDLIRRRVLKLSNIEFLILDEADEMLNMGFIEDIEEIIENCSEDRQTLLFSATMPSRIKSLAKNYLKKDAEHVKIAKKTVTTASIEQYYFETKPQNRTETLCRVLDFYSPDSSIIFCNTKKEVDNIVLDLQKKGYNVEGMHGDMTQSFRMRTLENFRNKNIAILVATDVAARGIDVTGVTHVINFGIPYETESYIHRVGRTGRADSTGTAYTIITGKDRFRFKQIEKTLKCIIERLETPKIEDIFKAKMNNIEGIVKDVVEKGDVDKFKGISENLLEKFDAKDIIAGLLKLKYEDEISYEIEDNKLDEVDTRSNNNSGNSRRKNKAAKGEIRLFINIGLRDKFDKGKLKKFISENFKLSDSEINKITVLDKFSFFNTKEDNLSKIMKNAKTAKSGSRKVNVEVSNSK